MNRRLSGRQIREEINDALAEHDKEKARLMQRIDPEEFEWWWHMEGQYLTADELDT